MNLYETTSSYEEVLRLGETAQEVGGLVAALAPSIGSSANTSANATLTSYFHSLDFEISSQKGGCAVAGSN
jgi:hypothetical protein